ncbi:mercury resistance system periplasmic binding protein MerP [Burkholderia cepacia]|uniref:Periplasmic mercury ion-binding protein n=1 Tax=Burkholderia cepacia TaxID=292 RepID=A0AAX2RRX6_BURCE|nr:mercury resistance system periplasmic binding protein MerP [Burkholderia cepacia]TES62198.1 mercury resistance system periplasmic binding protein MerP [Burkholderia cepacia]TET01610.1 mercury resistance system periplasmic binding protein MerP [Burkholderia cepacia]TEU47468.1 mercury resistance system periplasmic binding protein MerP [Burkholderia cepacia]TEU53495.1 mercury resistance system periplasmic binding protein MerP [Burkholderia cepacia]TEV02101.1 mercury resistance system periplasm
MRILSLAVLLVLPLVALAGAPRTITLDVQNMTCALCPVTVRKSLEQVPGVSAVHVDFDRKTAIVTYDPDRVQPASLTRATTNAGYPSTMHQ